MLSIYVLFLTAPLSAKASRGPVQSRRRDQRFKQLSIFVGDPYSAGTSYTS
jgi:hypothetical protein